MHNEEFEKATYSETRTINIGNYENITAFASLSVGVKHFNRVDKTIMITHTESKTVDQFNRDTENTFNMLKKSVRSVLNEREKQIRLATEDYVDFSTMSKYKNLE